MYSGTLINSKNIISKEIKSRIITGNRCFYSLGQIFISTATSKSVKLKYKTMVKSTAVYGSETWPLTKMERKRLNTWERKILRRIYGPVTEQGQ
jgi:hypothetical protein